jgi:hypothetical protein
VTARRAAATASLLALLFGRLGHDAVAAETRMRVLIVIDESDDPFAERIKAEVSALGLEVVAIEPWRTGESIESLDAAGRNNQAAAAIRMIPSRKGVEVWMANQPTGRSLLRQLVVDERAGTPNEGLVALQTAELLRTTLLSRSELPPKAPPPSSAPAGPADGPPQSAATEPRSPARSALQAAAGALLSPGAGDPALQLWMTISHNVVGPFGVALDVSGPLRAGTLSGPEGSATIGAWLAGAAVFWRYERPTTGLYAIAAAGGAVIHLDARATAVQSLLANSGSTTASAIYARADGGFAAAYWLRFGLRVVAGTIPSGVPVQFAGNQAGVWGRPLLATLLVVDLSW